MNAPTKREVRFLTIEPGRISLHGVALTDGEYAVLRGIAERMKLRTCTESQTGSMGTRPDLEAIQKRLMQELKQC